MYFKFNHDIPLEYSPIENWHSKAVQIKASLRISVFHNKMSTEMESDAGETFRAVWQKNFMSFESNSEKCLHFHFIPQVRFLKQFVFITFHRSFSLWRGINFKTKTVPFPQVVWEMCTKVIFGLGDAVGSSPSLGCTNLHISEAINLPFQGLQLFTVTFGRRAGDWTEEKKTQSSCLAVVSQNYRRITSAIHSHQQASTRPLCTIKCWDYFSFISIQFFNILLRPCQVIYTCPKIISPTNF